MNLIFGAISQVIATNAKRKPIANMQRDHLRNVLAQCRAFVYSIDNWLKNAIDTIFGGGILSSTSSNRILVFVLIFALLIAWLVMLILFIVHLKRDRDYVYYMHEEPRFYMRAFKMIMPVFLILPIATFLIGRSVGPQHSKPVATTQLIKQASSTSMKAMENIKQKHHGLDQVSDSDLNTVNADVAAGKATVVKYRQIVSESKTENNLQDGNNDRYKLVEYTQPHFKVAAYKNPQAVGSIIYLIYGLLVSIFASICMLTWHGIASEDQW